ncbi:hypothetical protein VaNZ11_000338 [Volvox africanus]|uniref:Uncharacterized protein n=1 Tax=Volvox africanus TaxID=51714 RepID=A0ABQ5RLX6_9CHLO|nr:hypothetical protein VaNZ11_000338 [Volvox africanus]
MDGLTGSSVVLGWGCRARAAAWLTNSAENSLLYIVGAGRRGLSLEWSTQEGVCGERSAFPLAIDLARRPLLLLLRPLPALCSLVACYSAVPDATLVSTSVPGPTYHSSSSTSPIPQLGDEARDGPTSTCATGLRSPIPNVRLVILTFVSPDRCISHQEGQGSLHQHQQQHHFGSQCQFAVERLRLGMEMGTGGPTYTLATFADKAVDDPSRLDPEPVAQPAINQQGCEQQQQQQQQQQPQAQYSKPSQAKPAVKRARLRAPEAASAAASASQVPAEVITEPREHCRGGAGDRVADISGGAAAQRCAKTTTNTASAPPSWSIYEPRLPGGMPSLPPLWHPDTTCALCLECWTEPFSRTLAKQPTAPPAVGANGSSPGGADVLSGAGVASAAWSRLPPLQQLAFMCGCDHVAVVPELYRGLLTPSSFVPPPRAPPPAVPGPARPAIIPPARLLWGCFLVGTVSGRLWAHPLHVEHHPAPVGEREAVTWGCQQGRREGEDDGARGGRSGSCGGPELLFDLQEPLVALLPVMPAKQQTEGRSGGAAGSRKAPAWDPRGAMDEFLPEECAAALLVVGSRGRVVALSPALAAASVVGQDAADLRGVMGRAQGRSSSGGGEGGQGATRGAPADACLLEVLQSFSLLAGAPLRLLHTREWQLGAPVESAVLTGGGALVWTTPSPTSSASRRLGSSRAGGRVKVLAAQLVAADMAGSSPCRREMFLPEIWPLCLPAPAGVRQLSRCFGTQHHVLALCRDGTAVLLQAHLPPPTPRLVGPPVDGAPARSSGNASSANSAAVSGCAAGLLAAMAQGAGVQENGGVHTTVGANRVLSVKQSDALKQQLRQLMDALVRLGGYEMVLRRAQEVQWIAFRRASQDLPIARSLATAAPALRCRLTPQLILSANAAGSGIVATAVGSNGVVQLLIEAELLAGRQFDPPVLGSVSLSAPPHAGHLLLRFLPHDPFLPSSCACVPLAAGTTLPLRHRVLLSLPVLALGGATSAGAAGGNELLPTPLHPSRAQLLPVGGTLQAMLLRVATASVLDKEGRPGQAGGSWNRLLTSGHQCPGRRACVDRRRPHRNTAASSAVLLLGQQTVTAAALLHLPVGTGALGPNIATAPYALGSSVGDAARKGFPGMQLAGQVASRGLSSQALMHRWQVQLLLRLPLREHMDRDSITVNLSKSADDVASHRHRHRYQHQHQHQQPAWVEEAAQQLLALLKRALLLPEGLLVVGLRGALRLCDERAEVRWQCRAGESRSDTPRMGSAMDRMGTAAGDKAPKTLPSSSPPPPQQEQPAEVEQRQPTKVKVSLELLADCPALLASLHASLQIALMESSRSRISSSGLAAAPAAASCNMIDGGANWGGSGGGGACGVPHVSTTAIGASRVGDGIGGLPCRGALQSAEQLREAIRVLRGLSSILQRAREQQQQLLSISAALRMQGPHLSPRQLQLQQKQPGGGPGSGPRENEAMEWEGEAGGQQEGDHSVQAVVLKVRQLRAALQDAYMRYGDVAASCMLLEVV